jgi:hypothetical protein
LGELLEGKLHEQFLWGGTGNGSSGNAQKPHQSFTRQYAFKQAVHTIGTFTYRFWMRNMDLLHYGDGDQHLHRKSIKYRNAVKRKLHAYHVHIQAGVIAQGLALYLSATRPKLVWNFCGWLRTRRAGVPPSEFVVARALRRCLPDFLLDHGDEHDFAKFIAEGQDIEDPGILRMAA